MCDKKKIRTDVIQSATRDMMEALNKHDPTMDEIEVIVGIQNKALRVFNKTKRKYFVSNIIISGLAIAISIIAVILQM